eukprot:CAMPEP_0168317672 /NCGR_PEP_ID=MMETSP0213-20121227/33_1 /TAXON_ID=151035 /ORGANISM="Euplotes harpa, Strain FSP1.4" /LENGTH=451 /DNA_ID=CAMNT_0008318613 /DNA_START=1 /DNA_END=1356 /DNA_ORIENTATION=+
MNTPTPPGKYFTEQKPQQRMEGTPQQMYRAREMYKPPVPLSRSTRPFETSKFEAGPESLVSRALNPRSRDFKPKKLQVQEYLNEFKEKLVTILNMTGSYQIQMNAEKLEEEILEEYIPAIAHFVVVTRVIESDERRIDFYARFFHCMKNKLIVWTLITECVEVIMRIIMNESVDPKRKNDTSRGSNSSVMNVATFLGHLTLVHNKPLLTEDLDLKQLILEAHDKKCIDIAIMVLCKILRTGEKSKIFNTFNPWMIGMYSILLEYMTYYIQNNPDFDRNVDKEIKIVLKAIPPNHEPIKESSLFRLFDRKDMKNPEIAYLINKISMNPLIIISKTMSDEGEKSTDRNSPEDKAAFGVTQDNDQANRGVIVKEAMAAFPDINEEYLKMLVNQAIIQAIKEIREPVIRRVIPITLITTRVMILKDFALESDAEKLKQASLYTSKSLSGMLASIT